MLLWNFAFGRELLLMMACPQVYGCFYRGRASHALNKVAWATETFRSWLLQHDFELPIVCGQQVKQFLLILLCLSTMLVGTIFKCTNV